MNTSEQIDQIATALAGAQAKMSNATFNKKNPHFGNRYADLAAIRDATVPALSANGLAITQFTSVGDAYMLLHTRLAHKSGQWIESIYPLPVILDKPQAMGSALTYAKRYSWASLCGVSAEEDDDANAAQDAPSKRNAARSNGAEPKPATVKLSIDESFSTASHMIEQIKGLAPLTAVTVFAQDNNETYGKLLPSDQKLVREALSKRKAETKAAETETVA